MSSPKSFSKPDFLSGFFMPCNAIYTIFALMFTKVFSLIITALWATNAWTQVNVNNQDSAKIENNIHHHGPDSASIKYISFNLKHNNIIDSLHLFNYNIPFFFSKFSSIDKLASFNGNAGSFKKSFSQTDFINNNQHFSLLPFSQHLITNTENFQPVLADYPASNAFYSSGKGEQHFNVFHTQKIDSAFAITINYQLLTAPGLYTNQRTNQSAFSAFTTFISKNFRYAAWAGVTTNRIQQKENGGIAIKEEFEDSVVYDRQFTLVNFITAERTFKQSEVFFQNYYKISKNKSMLPLVVGLKTERKGSHNIFTDTDPMNSPYPQVLFDSVITYDSTRIYLYTNSISFSNFSPIDSLKPSFRYWFEYSHINVFMNQSKVLKQFEAGKIHAGFHIELPANVSVNANADFYKGNFNDNNYSFQAVLRKNFNKGLVKDAIAGVKSDLRDPLFVYQQYVSNHFVWDNDFNTVKQNSLFAFVNTQLGSLKATYTVLHDYVCLNENLLPQQYSEAISLLNFHFHSIITPGKFYIESTAGMNTISQDAPLRLPSMYAELKTGIQFPMFKNAIKVFLGVESIYFTSFQADIWSPATGLFAIQNQVETGSYFYPGVFAGVNLKRARLFVMMDNVAAGFLPFNYYAMPGYPRYDRFFRFGLSWSFFN
jgi:hypothetical protein